MKKFTLIELLVVIAILGILFSLLLPSLSNAREKGRQAVCLSNYKQMGTMLTVYTTDEAGFLPGIVNDFFTPAKVKTTNLPGFLRVYANKEIGDYFELYHCPSLTRSFSNKTDPQKVSMINVFGDLPDTNERAFGNPNHNTAPKQITQITEPSKSTVQHEIWKGTRSANDIPAAPLHGYKAGAPQMNILRFDQSAKFETDLWSIQ